MAEPDYESIEQEFAQEEIKSLTPENTQGVSVGIVNPEAVVIETDDGGVEVDFDPNQGPANDADFSDNLADTMEESDLSELASELISSYEDDRSSRSEWETTYTDGLEMLGIKLENRTQPFEGSASVTHPILSEAVVRFVSQSIMEIFPSSGPVRTQMVGSHNEEKHKQSLRVENYLNFLLTEEIPEYRTETEQLLFQLSLAGSAFRKVYYDPYLKRPTSVFVPAEDFVVSYATTDLMNSPRYTHVMEKSENFVRKLQIRGFYRDVDLSEGDTDDGDIKTK